MSDFREEERDHQSPYAQERPKKPWPVMAIALTLFVGAVIVILAPVFLQSKGRDRGVLGVPCLSNHKQVITAALMYAGDFDERLPLVARWVDISRGYVKSEHVFHCPLKGWVYRYGHAVDSRMGGVMWEQFPDVANRAYFFDSTSRFRNASDPLLSPRFEAGGNIVVAWLDGHVSKKGPAAFAQAAALAKEDTP